MHWTTQFFLNRNTLLLPKGWWHLDALFTWLKYLTWAPPPVVSSSILPFLAQHTLFHRVPILVVRFWVRAPAWPQQLCRSGLYKTHKGQRFREHPLFPFRGDSARCCCRQQHPCAALGPIPVPHQTGGSKGEPLAFPINSWSPLLPLTHQNVHRVVLGCMKNLICGF